MSKGRYVLPRWLDENLTPEQLRRVVEEEASLRLFGARWLPSADVRGIDAKIPRTLPGQVTYKQAITWSGEDHEKADEAVRTGIAQAIDRMTCQSFGLPPEPSPTTAATPGADLGDIVETLRRIRPVLYYAENEALTPRMVLHAPERPGWPEVIFCHPDDLPGLRKRLPWLSLRPFREWSPRPEDIEAAFQEAIAAFSKDGG